MSSNKSKPYVTNKFLCEIEYKRLFYWQYFRFLSTNKHAKTYNTNTALNIRGAHSPDEKVQISSVQKYWGYLLEVLKRMPQA
jgi:hypothetical protein